MNDTLTIVRKTIKIAKLQDLPRKKKKALKKAMMVKWYEAPINPDFLMHGFE